ncbi:Hypothetical protein AT6N2_L2064 [Agrobacterium tumefaciens]|nr:Hypothetical protein AT6N2_L2064 [Agrobacterium tumefaciens]
MPTGAAGLDAVDQHGGCLPPHLLARNFIGGETHGAACGPDMAAKHDHRKCVRHDKPPRPRQCLDAHGIGQFYEEGDCGPALNDGIKYFLGRAVDRLDMQGNHGRICERRAETLPAIGNRFCRTIRSDIGEPGVSQRDGVFDKLTRARGVVAADIGNRTTGIFTAADRDEGIVFRNQPGEFLAIELAAENQTAVRNPKPVALRENLAVIADTGARQQQKIISLLLRLFFDTQQEGRKEISLGARECWLIGENAEDPVQPLGHAPRNRIGNITGLANDGLHPFPGFVRDARDRCRRAVQNKRHRCLADTGKLGDIVLRETSVTGHAMPSSGIRSLLIRISS